MKKSDKTESRIDEKNQELWNARFGDSASVAKEAVSTITICKKTGYLRGMAYAQLNAAAGNFLQSKNDAALKYLAEAYSWFENNRQEKGFVRVLLLKGNIFESFGDYEKTLKLWLEAYKYSKELGDRESEGESCSQLGLIYTRLCNFDKALEFFEKGLLIREELGDENAMASSLNRIGMVFRQTKKYDESLVYYFRSLEIRTKNNQLSAIPWTLLGIANTYEEQGKFSESLDYYERGLKGSDKRCTLQCLMGAGRVYSRIGKSELGESRLRESFGMAVELNSAVLIAEAHLALSNHFEYCGSPEKALKSFKEYLKVKESYQSTELQSKLANIEVAHAIEKSENEKEIFRLKNVDLKRAYDIIEEKNKDITASINYASRIQRAILPEMKEIDGLEESAFIVYLPKDIVSGDFYWFSQVKDKLLVTVGDCTGHGVPGALMSMLGISFLEEIINNREVTDPGVILCDLRNEVQRALKQKGNNDEAKDGMDISLCAINKSKKTIEFAGAYNNLYLIRNNDLLEYQADKMPIGIFELSGKEFTKQVIHYHSGDMIYMSSDGYSDQFGGPNFKKFKSANLKNLLVDINKLPLTRQKHLLTEAFIQWKGDNPQTDDVTIMGIRL